MNLVSSFFFRSIIFGIYVSSFLSPAMPCLSQEIPADSASTEPPSVLAKETTPSNPTYQKALETFGGPTTIHFAPRDRSDLGIWGTPDTVEETGIVLDWNDEKVTLLRPSSEEPVSIVTRGVYRISHTFRFAVANELQAAFREGRFQDSLAMAPKILGSKAEGVKLARWEQKLVLAMLIESCKAVDRWDLACNLFVSLAKESPPDLLAASIPIPWFDSIAEIRDRDKIRANASSWLQDPNEMVQLLGASWLLDGELRDDALKVLKTLSRDSKHPLVNPLATAQLWRTVPPTEFVKRQLASARSLRDSVFLPAQAGPTLLLGERSNRSGEHELALQEWIRVVTIHPDQSTLARHALQSALDLLRSTDRKEMASQLEKLAGKISK